MRPPRRFSLVPGPVLYFFLVLVGALYAGSHWSGSMLWPYAWLYWVLVGGFLYCYSRIQPLDILSPVLGLIVLLFLYSFATGLYVEEYGVLYFGESVSNWVRSIYYLACLSGLLGLCLGGLLGTHGQHAPQKTMLQHSLARLVAPEPSILRRLVVGAMVLGLLLWPWVRSQFDFFSVPSYSERAL